jgi:hypothetical protein
MYEGDETNLKILFRQIAAAIIRQRSLCGCVPPT